MLRVLTYHRVAELKDSLLLHPRMISATPAVFARQMRYLATHYQVVSMVDVLNTIEKRGTLPRRAVLITFDDAYDDFARVAWPILKRHRLPVTLFVPTAFPDHPECAFWWDRLYRAIAYTTQSELNRTPLGALPLKNSQQRSQSLRKLQDYVKTMAHGKAMALVDEICLRLGTRMIVHKSVLGWDELRRVANDGVTLGAHTRTHPIMKQLSPDDIRQEIAGSQSDLKREIGRTVPVFCYPDGAYNDTVINALKETGFKTAFTTCDGQNDLRSAHPLQLRRTNISRRTSFFLFRLRLWRWSAFVDAKRHQAHLLAAQRSSPRRYAQTA